MTTTAVVLMILVMGTISAFAGYLFLKVLRTPPKPEPDSYGDNDPR
jgi:hypothetical protein